MVSDQWGEMPYVQTRDGIQGWLVAGRWLPLMAGAEGESDPPASPPPPATPPPPADPPRQDDPPKGGDDDPYDKPRAMATIQKLRADLKAAKEQGQELETLRAKLQAAEDAQLSDQERIQREAEQVRQERDAAKAEAERLKTEREAERLARAVEREARAQGFADPEDAHRFLDASAIERDDEGAPKGLKRQLEELLKAKPYLKGAGHNGAPAGVPATPRASGDPSHEDKVAEATKKLRATGNYQM